MKIYLVRHGETDWNKAYRFQGQADIPLNENGIALAEKTAQALQEIPFEAVFSSPLCRAVETAKILTGKRRLSIKTDRRLQEIGFGVCEGTVVPPELKDDYTNPLYYFWKEPENYLPPENAESFEELYSRSASFLKERILPLEKKYKTVLIVGHGALNRSILNPIAGIPRKNFWQIPLKNCAVSQIALENGSFRLLVPGEIYY